MFWTKRFSKKRTRTPCSPRLLRTISTLKPKKKGIIRGKKKKKIVMWKNQIHWPHIACNEFDFEKMLFLSNSIFYFCQQRVIPVRFSKIRWNPPKINRCANYFLQIPITIYYLHSLIV